jgi:hypothetical protein
MGVFVRLTTPSQKLTVKKNIEEGIAKLQFGAKSALFAEDSVSAHIAYSQSSMSICAETEPAQKSSDLTSKASFAIPSEVIRKSHGSDRTRNETFRSSQYFAL